MRRLFARWIIASVVATAASTARAEQRPTYAVKVEASRAGEQVLVSATITESLADGKSTKTIAQPRIIMLEGQRGEVVIGQPVADGGAAQPPAPPVPRHAPGPAFPRGGAQTAPA